MNSHALGAVIGQSVGQNTGTKKSEGLARLRQSRGGLCLA
jgi:hypothetical protein